MAVKRMLWEKIYQLDLSVFYCQIKNQDIKLCVEHARFYFKNYAKIMGKIYANQLTTIIFGC
jgi:hypothetical protein